MADQDVKCNDMTFGELRKSCETTVPLRYNWTALKLAIKQGKCYLILNAGRIDLRVSKDTSGNPYHSDKVEHFTIAPLNAFGGEIYLIACKNIEDALALHKVGRKFGSDVSLVSIKRPDAAKRPMRKQHLNTQRKNI